MATSGSKDIAVTSSITLRFSWELKSQSVANNTSAIDWKLTLIAGTYGRISSSVAKDWSVTVNGSRYSGTNMVAINNGETKTLASGTTAVAHNSDGTKTFSYSFSQEFAITFSSAYVGTITGSGNGTLTTIPRKSTMAVGNGILGTEQTLTVTRQSNTFTHSITATCGNASVTICTKSSATSIPFKLPLEWARQNTVGPSVSVKYTITTYNGKVVVGSELYTRTCTIPDSVAPGLSVNIEEGSDLGWGIYVQGHSRLKISINATMAYGSQIASYKTTVDGKTYSESSFTTDVLRGVGDIQITTVITDKRGATATDTQKINVWEYALPVFNTLKVRRCNEDGTENMQGEYAQVTFDCSLTQLNAQNELEVRVEYKKTTEENYTLHTQDNFSGAYPGTGEQTTIFSADSDDSYDVRVVANDVFSTVSKQTVLSTGFSIIHWLASGLGIAFGKIAELSGVLDIGFKTRFFGGILHPVLGDGVDLNDIKTSNTYEGKEVSANKYLNCPITAGRFFLDVQASEEGDLVRQRLTYCHKTETRIYERFFYDNTWGNWICIFNQTA